MSNNQLGFKKIRNYGIEMIIYALISTVHNYLSREIPVFVCFLYLSKAFNRVYGEVLFNVLNEKNVPNRITDILGVCFDNEK